MKKKKKRVKKQGRLFAVEYYEAGVTALVGNIQILPDESWGRIRSILATNDSH